MLHWKPRLIALVVALALVAAALGQFTWDSVDQLTWF
jgi:hypothetical protein